MVIGEYSGGYCHAGIQITTDDVLGSERHQQKGDFQHDGDSRNDFCLFHDSAG